MLKGASVCRVRGLTLTELLVAIAIVAIGASLAAPAIAQMVAGFRVRSTADSLLAGLQYARAEAVRRNTAVSFTLTGGTGWAVSQVSPATALQSRTSQDSAAITVTPAGSANALTFLPTGLVQSGSRLAQMTVASLADSAKARRIDIFAGGLIRMCDPSVPAAGDPRRC